jgi:hypothetical protein
LAEEVVGAVMEAVGVVAEAGVEDSATGGEEEAEELEAGVVDADITEDIMEAAGVEEEECITEDGHFGIGFIPHQPNRSCK